MERLSNELLQEILDCIGVDAESTVSIDRRAYLSVESFAAPSAPAPAQAQDLASFRLVCRRFARLGLSHQFTRVTTRFSRRGFARLEGIAGSAHLARQVKKFSYMVPCFYVQGRERITELFQQFQADQFQGDLSCLDAAHFIRKAQDQREIVESACDLQALKSAISAFTSLQHVQILRLQDEPDRLLWEYIREHHDSASEYVELKWMPACVHGTRTICEALLEAQSPFTRFSGPMMNPQSVLILQDNPVEKVSSLASRLTCLELHFDEGFDLDRRMRQLSPLLRTVFHAATGMLAVHIGFPSRTPLALALEDIFHDVRWERLRAFGIQAWRLDAEEIIALARRHRRTLRGLRLRDILLKGSSRWKTVLGMLRDEMEQLDWVSLRRIGYARTFDEHFAGTMEVPPDPPGGGSDSDIEDGFSTHLANDDQDDHDNGPNIDTNIDTDTGTLSVGGHSASISISDADSNSDSASNSDSDSGSNSNSSYLPTSHHHHHHHHHLHHHHLLLQNNAAHSTTHDPNDDQGPEAHAVSMLGTDTNPDPDTPSSAPWCNCNCSGRNGTNVFYPETAEDLGDSGIAVSMAQRKMWERWVVGRCAEHS